MDGGVNDIRIVGTVALFIMVAICAVGMDWEVKAQNFLLVAILVAIAAFAVGAVMGPSEDADRAKGFLGFSTAVVSSNWDSLYRFSEGIQQNFFSVFAIFFPSVTGIQSGANICGDLKDPASAIPKGTLLACLVSAISYIMFALLAGSTAVRDASGNLTDLVGVNFTSCDTMLNVRTTLIHNKNCSPNLHFILLSTELQVRIEQRLRDHAADRCVQHTDLHWMLGRHTQYCSD